MLPRIEKQDVAGSEGKCDPPPREYKLAAGKFPHRHQRTHAKQVAGIAVVRCSEVFGDVDSREHRFPKPPMRNLLDYGPLVSVEIC